MQVQAASRDMPSIAVATPVEPAVGSGPAAEGPSLCPPELEQRVIAAGVHAMRQIIHGHMPHVMAQVLDGITRGHYESPGLRLDGSGLVAGVPYLLVPKQILCPVECIPPAARLPV